MVLWFAGLSFALVLMVFDSPLLDFRLVITGSLLPWLDWLWAPPWVLHSVLFPVFLMSAVMVVFRGQRLRQRRWLGLSIGAFMHLLLAATFTDRTLFWWPVFGTDVGERPAVPGVALAVLLELVGLGVLVWLVIKLGLRNREHRDRFVQSGHVDRAAL